MESYLSKLEPNGRDVCLCGSGVRFKNCCKNIYSEKRFDGFDLFNKGKYKKALTAIRSQITWYRLRHMAHTVPFLKSNSEESKKLLKTDIDAMSDMINLLLYCYVECNIIGGYVSALEKMEDAIRDDRWKIKIDYYKCICIYNNDIKSAINLLEKYDRKVIDDVDLLTVILDVNSDILSQIDLMGIAEKICELSDSPTIKLQYRTSMGINYCLLNDIENGISIIKRAVTEYEELPQENKTSAGRRHLSKSYLHLGELSGKGEYLTTAVEGIKREIKTKGQSQKGEAQLWSDLAYCLHYLGKLNESLSAYTKSINLSHSNLTLIFKSRVLLKLDKAVEARSMLSDVNITELTPANLFDFAISKCKLAILTKHISGY